ncbi:MAG: hypothetical protein ACJ71W_20595 [Terriglobales bacterium]
MITKAALMEGVYLVHEISPPDPKDAPLFFPYLIATILGVAVNAVILALIWRQTEINWRQVKVALRTARAAEASAQSAQKSADVLIASQLPQVAAKPHGNPGEEFCDPKGQHVQIALYNTGMTTAYDCAVETWIEVINPPFVGFTGKADYSKRADVFSLYSKDKPVIINIPIETTITPEKQRAIKHHQLLLCVRLLVNYRDSFTPNRYANFGYVVMGGGLGFLPKYNDSN